MAFIKLLVFVSFLMTAYSEITFEEEVLKRVKGLETLAQDYRAYFESIDNAEAYTTNLYKANEDKWEKATVDNTKAQVDAFGKYMANKETGLQREIKDRWNKTDAFAESKKTSLRWYRSLTKLNLTEEFWRLKVNNKQWRTKSLNYYINVLNMLLNDVSKLGFPAMEEKVKTLESGKTSEEELAVKQEKIKVLKDEFYKLAQYAAAAQFHEEEKQRTEGQSGIKQIRTTLVGSENYYSNTHSGNSFCSIHDHSNNIRTVGMGEFVGVLNGYEFRTRHNDYRLYQPSKTSNKYHSTGNVPFPSVPPEVSKKNSVAEQITEMREWFKAWVNQDGSVRDYTKYFKPVMVYLEGAWTAGAADGNIDEPFSSDRHHIDATSWLDLQDKVRFTSYSGLKSLLENLAHLPTKITRFTDNQEPVLAQFNYRILCHPISGKFSTKYFEPRYDAASQAQRKRDDEKYVQSRAARFDIEGISVNGTRDSGAMDYNLLDSIMEQIPGKDNYLANIPGVAFDGSLDHLYTANPNKQNERLNLGYYHRTFVQKSADGKIRKQDQRGFSDRVYVAHTTQDRIAPQTYTDKSGNVVNTKVSFAIPVEVIFLTPLNSWNPYNISVEQNPSGSGTAEKPLSGASSRNWYLTPTEFFSGGEVEKDFADTSKGEVVVKTPEGDRKVRASGTRIFFPKIDGIDKTVRQRYPIMPIHGEGTALWKKLNALEDALGFAEGATYGNGVAFDTGISHVSFTSGHDHIVYVDENDLNRLRNGEIQSFQANTETANGHFHRMTIAMNPNRDQAGQSDYFIQACDSGQSGDKVCFDKHSNTLAESTAK